MKEIKLAVQLVAIAVVAAGITYEIMTGAHLGFILITGGSLVFAISTKIRR